MLTIFLAFGFAFYLFSKLSQIALAWFVRGRWDQRWDSRARAMAVAASLPLAVVNSMFVLNLLFLLAQLAAEYKWPVPGLAAGVQLVDKYEYWFLFALVWLFLARMVPPAVAGSKIFAYNYELKASANGPWTEQ